jgi:nucleotide-binding universal stress UspA family protein
LATRLGYANAQAQVVTGDPGRVIVTAASETDADMIIMGVAPHTWLDRLVAGSTLRQVLHRAAAPVLVVPVTGGAEPWSEDTIHEALMDVLPRASTPVRPAA